MGNHRLSTLALIAALSLSALSGGADALSMGAVQKSYAASVNPGEAAALTLLFWNVEGAPYGLELSADSIPNGWSVIFDQSNFTLDSEPSGRREYIYLPYLKKSIGAKAVDVYVHVPDNAASGKRIVSVMATMKPPGGVRQVNLVGQKKFAFAITVTGTENAGEEQRSPAVSIENPGILETSASDFGGGQRAVVIENPGTFALSPSENVTDADSGNWSQKPFFAAVAAILVIAWVIYRYA